MPRFACSRFLVQSGLNRIALALLFTLGFAALAHAQDGAVDPNFNVAFSQPMPDGRNHFVGSIFPQRDGKILAGGFFGYIGGKGINNLARLNADGTADPTFNARLSRRTEVYFVIPDDQGRVLIRTVPGPIQGIPRPGFARLKANGDLDTSFLPPSGVQGFTIDQLGRIFVWGISISDGNTRRRGLARLNPDGSIDTNFTPAFSPEDSVRKAAIDPLGRIVILGDLKKTDGNVSPGLIRLNADGSSDPGFIPGIALRVPPSFLTTDSLEFALDPFGRAVISNFFTPNRRLVRLNLNGSVDTGFNPPDSVGDLFAFTPSGNVIANQTEDSGIHRLRRLNQDGTLDTTFVSPILLTYNVFSVDTNGRVLFGEAYLSVNNNSRTLPLGRLNENGSLDETFRIDGPGKGLVWALATDSSGRSLVGGIFELCGTFPIPALARINADGTVDTGFRPFRPVPSSGNQIPFGVTSIALDSANRILVYGGFTNIGGGARTNLARLNPDGTLDPTFDAGTVPPASFGSKIVVAPNGKIYVGGGFSQFNGFNRPHLVRLNSDGSVDSGFQPVDTGVPTNSVSPFALDSTGKIIIRSANGLARLNPDGSLDPTFTAGFTSEPFGSLNFFVVENDRILVELGLSNPPYNQLFRLNADGSPDNSFFNPLPPNTYSSFAAVAPNGKILLYFASGGSPILRLNSDGTIDTTFRASKVESGNFLVRAIAFDGNGRVLVGGDFSHIDNIPRAGLCRLTTDQCLDEVSPTELSIPASGETGTLNFTVPGSTCPRRVDSAYPWISVLSSGNGSATVSYSIAPNRGQQRTGFIRVNNRLVTVTQAGDCSDTCACPTIAGNSITFLDTGGQGMANFSLPSSCPWEASTDVPWILITSPVQGQGSGTIQYRVLPNYGTLRSGKVTVGNVNIFITQRPRRIPAPGSYRPSTGFAYLRNTADTGFADTEFFYGQAGDIPISGDWDGTGGDSIGVYRNGVFYLRNANSSGFSNIQFAYGQPGDIPIAGDWDGDGIDTIGVIRGNRVLLRNSNTAGPADIDFNYGADTDIFIVGDWNGDGIDTIGAYRQSNGFVYLRNSNTSGFADTEFFYGLAGDRPIAGDWDGDGIDTIGVVRGNRWLLRNSNTSGFADIDFNFGADTDIPIVGDWNGAP